MRCHQRSEERRIAAVARFRARQRPADDPADDVVATIDAEALWPQVAEAIGRLPEGERAALLLYVWEELSYDDIAAALDIPVGTVRSRLNRARVALRELQPVPYNDERAALDYLVRVFQLQEIREARTDFGDNMLAWLRAGDGVVMIGRANASRGASLAYRITLRGH